MPRQSRKNKQQSKHRAPEPLQTINEHEAFIPENDALPDENLRSTERNALINVGKSVLIAALTGALCESTSELAVHRVLYKNSKKSYPTITGMMLGAIIGAAMKINIGLSSEDEQEQQEFSYASHVMRTMICGNNESNLNR